MNFTSIFIDLQNVLKILGMRYLGPNRMGKEFREIISIRDQSNSSFWATFFVSTDSGKYKTSDDLSEGLFNVLNTLNGACKLAFLV